MEKKKRKRFVTYETIAVLKKTGSAMKHVALQKQPVLELMTHGRIDCDPQSKYEAL